MYKDRNAHCVCIGADKTGGKERRTMFKLFRNLEVKEICTIGCDPGEGISYCAAVAISQKYNDTPFTFHARVGSSQFGYELFNLGLYVKKKTGEFPLLAVERNLGAATIAKLLDLNYPSDKLYKQKSFDRVMQKIEERIGFVTSAANRRKILDDLALKVRNKGLKVYDEEILNEMLTFVINERTNEPRPESGRFSDLIMALAICNQIAGEYITPLSGRQTNKKNERFLPETAEGFIVEHAEERKDWRTV